MDDSASGRLQSCPTIPCPPIFGPEKDRPTKPLHFRATRGFRLGIDVYIHVQCEPTTTSNAKNVEMMNQHGTNMETNMANPGDDNSVQEIAPHVNGERSSRCKYELVHCLDGPFMFQMNTKNKWSSDINLSTDRLNRPSQQDPTATSQSTTTLRCSRKPADFPGVGITRSPQHTPAYNNKSRVVPNIPNTEPKTQQLPYFQKQPPTVF